MSRKLFRSLNLPFRVGATSYVVPADLVENALYLSDLVDDMQIVLFDLPDGPGNIPTAGEVAKLRQIGERTALSYTVHLIHDLTPADMTNDSIRSAMEVIDLTLPISPWAYVLHLEGKRLRGLQPADDRLIRWQAQQQAALERLGEHAAGVSRLAVENLEGYAPDFVTRPVEMSGASRCVDVGHLWLDGHDPMPYLMAARPRTRVIHLHGVVDDGVRRVDHRSLSTMTPDALDPILAYLVRSRFGGVLTLEVFEEEDFSASVQALWESLERLDDSC